MPLPPYRRPALQALAHAPLRELVSMCSCRCPATQGLSGRRPVPVPGVSRRPRTGRLRAVGGLEAAEPAAPAAKPLESAGHPQPRAAASRIQTGPRAPARALARSLRVRTRAGPPPRREDSQPLLVGPRRDRQGDGRKTCIRYRDVRVTACFARSDQDERPGACRRHPGLSAASRRCWLPPARHRDCLWANSAPCLQQAGPKKGRVATGGGSVGSRPVACVPCRYLVENDRKSPVKD